MSAENPTKKDPEPTMDGAMEFLLHVAKAYDDAVNGKKVAFGNRRNPWARDLSQPLRPEQKSHSGIPAPRKKAE